MGHSLQALSADRSEHHVTAALRTIIRSLWWGYQETEVSLEYVDATSIYPLVTGVEKPRVHEALVLTEAARAAELRVFDTYVVEEANSVSLVLPPVAEAHGPNFILVDGVHRIWAARTLEILRVNVLVVRGTLPPLPRSPAAWSDLALESPPRTLDQILGAYDVDLFRPVAPAVSTLRFGSRQEMLDYVDGRASSAPSG